MIRVLFRCVLLAGLSPLVPGREASAQAPPAGPVCHCSRFAGPHVHLGVGPRDAQGRGASSGPGASGGAGVSPNERGLPRGRRYYGGRYFGSFNNRFYGPQYGYF